MKAHDYCRRPRLFIGPMSKEIINIAIQYSTDEKPLGIIPSRRQIEFTGGYVNNWKTQEFVDYIRRKNDSMLLVRDHGGPQQGLADDDGLESLKFDMLSGLDVLHIDPWKTVSDINGGIKKTIEIIKFCCDRSDRVIFEIGTEEAIFAYGPNDLSKIITDIKKEVGINAERIQYAVVQSGVKISGTKNIGEFDSDKLRIMTDICQDHGLISKEHNGDYLSIKEIQARVDHGLECINIAPEFGVTQTKLLLANAFTRPETLEAYQVCKKLKKYIKWLPECSYKIPSAQLITEVSGHYAFTKEPFVSSMGVIEEALQKTLRKRFDAIIECWS